jgi:hypothetical protein
MEVTLPNCPSRGIEPGLRAAEDPSVPAALRFTLVLVLIALCSAVLAVREHPMRDRASRTPPAALR